MSNPGPSPDSGWQSPVPRWTGWACVGLVTGWILHKVWAGLFIPWWFNTDEVVFYYEVIRQLRLDFSQTFFDIPGTPYMTLTSVLTALWWVVEKLLGMTAAAGPSDFAFEHVQGVYQLMRCLTLGCYVVAVGLAYSIFRRVSGAIVGCVAAILLGTLPIHVQYSHFVRTESLGLVLCLTAVLALLHPRTRLRWQTYLVAGVLAGIAIGARFHFGFVGLPVLFSLYFFGDRKDPNRADPPVVVSKRLWVAGGFLAGIFIVGGMITLLFKVGNPLPAAVTRAMLLTTAAGPEQYPGAKHAVAKLWLLLGSVSLALVALHMSVAERRWLRHLVNPLSLALFVGVAGGFLLGHPTFLWRGEHQLRSIQFYSDWTDPQLEVLGPVRSWWNVSSYYFTTALPELWVRCLFAVGVVWIIGKREARSVAFLIGAAVCFVAHPVTMKLWPHHIIPWLPFLCYVAAFPVGTIIDLVTRRLRNPWLAAVVLLLVTALVVAGIFPRFGNVDSYVKTSRERTVQIERMNQWLTANVPADTFLAVGYFALNRDGFLKWIESAGVSVPPQVKRFRDLEIWWLQRSVLDGKAGYVCISRADIAFFREDAEKKSPGSTYNPFEDGRFKEVATFGGGFYELKVFKFDFRPPPAR